jgi:hypothetical protein
VSLGAGEKKRRMGIDHEGNALVRASIVGAAMACDIAVNYPMCCPLLAARDCAVGHDGLSRVLCADMRVAVVWLAARSSCCLACSGSL